MGWVGNSKGIPPEFLIPALIRFDKSKKCLLHGDKSLPLCAMPIIGMPDCNSSRVKPKLRYLSKYKAVMLGLSGLLNQF